MSWAKNGMLLLAGGALGLCLAAALEVATENDSRKTYDDDEIPDGMDLLVSKIRYDAEVAMEACSTDEERETVFEQVKEAVQDIQEIIQVKGDGIITALRERTHSSEDESKENRFAWRKYPGGNVPPIPKWMLKDSNQHETPLSHVQEIKETMQKMTDVLDETLDAIKPAGSHPIQQV